MGGYFNVPYRSEEAPNSLIPRKPGQDEGGASKSPSASEPLHEADHENLTLLHKSVHLVPSGDPVEHLERHAKFAQTELATRLPKFALDRLRQHMKDHVDQVVPLPASDRTEFEQAGELAMLLHGMAG